MQFEVKNADLFLQIAEQTDVNPVNKPHEVQDHRGCIIYQPTINQESSTTMNNQRTCDYYNVIDLRFNRHAGEYIVVTFFLKSFIVGSV